jgi:hypothetical protein
MNAFLKFAKNHQLSSFTWFYIKMKVLSVAAAVALLANQATAHYIWTTLDIAGQSGTGAAGGIRPNSNYNSPVTGKALGWKRNSGYWKSWKLIMVIDLSSPDLRCNVGGLTGTTTAIRDIRAGQQFTFKTDVAVYHQGPLAVYISKANGNLQTYQGDGTWIKIAELGMEAILSGYTTVFFLLTPN